MPFARRDFSDRRHRLKHADFVVGVEQGNENGLRRDRLFKRAEVKQAIASHGQIAYAKAQLFEMPAGIEHRAMLRLPSDDVLATRSGALHRAFEGKIDGLGAAAGENDLAELCSDGVRHLCAREFTASSAFQPKEWLRLAALPKASLK